MKYRVLRGGSFSNDSWNLRSTFRLWVGPEVRFGRSGFRVVVRRKKP